MTLIFKFPALAAATLLASVSGCTNTPYSGSQPAESMRSSDNKVAKPFTAQIIGLQWLNPLQRRDYPTEWQLLWTLGLSKPNLNDDLVKLKPNKYSTVQSLSPIASDINGNESFKGYHAKYVNELIYPMHDKYFSSSTYFYNAHSLFNKKNWRELGGIHIEYALPAGKISLK